MYTIEYRNNEDVFEFTTPAIQPFQAYGIWQEYSKWLGECEIISLRKDENYKVRVF